MLHHSKFIFGPTLPTPSAHFWTKITNVVKIKTSAPLVNWSHTHGRYICVFIYIPRIHPFPLSVFLVSLMHMLTVACSFEGVGGTRALDWYCSPPTLIFIVLEVSSNCNAY